MPRWFIFNAHQQRTFIPRLYGVGTSLLDAVDTELDRIGRDGTPDRPPSEWFFSEVKRLSQLTAALEVPSLSTSDETLTIEESMNLEGENGERRNVGDEHEWSWSCG